MGLEKAIEHGKEHRKQYMDARAVSRACRNHGGCQWCEYNRTYHNRKRLEAARLEFNSFKRDSDG